MNIMNLIHAICLNKNRISNTPKWKFISVYKANKNLNNSISTFLSLDIFDASNNLISFLLSLGELSNTIHGITYSDTFIDLDIGKSSIDIHGFENLKTNAHVIFYPKSNRFEIISDVVSYTIYRNTKNGNTVNKMWEPLTNDLKEIYIDIILRMAEYINTPHILNNNY